MANKSMMDQRKAMRRSAWMRVMLVCCVGGLLFGLVNFSHVRSDWTEDHVYSLSDSTKQVLDALDEPLMIRAYITSDMPQPYGHLQRFIEDMLQSYSQAGHGNVGFDIIDPASDANILAALQALHIPKVQVQVVENDQAQVKQGYLAIVLEYLDRKEVISVLQSEEGFEYLLTKKIKKLTGKGRVKIGVTSSFGAHRLDELRRFAAWMKDDYELVSLDLSQQAVPNDVQAVIVDGMLSPPSEGWRFHLDQFRMRGGGIWILASNARPALVKGFDVQPVAEHSNDWLHDDLGIAVDVGLVMDKRAQRVVVRNGLFQSQVDYPFVPNVLDLNETHVITKDLESVSVPFASPLQAVQGKAQLLMQSSPWSAVQGGPDFDVYPLMEIDKRFGGLQMKSQSLAFVLDGEMTSAFAQPPQGMDDSFLRHTDLGRVLVMGSAGFLDDEFMDGSALVMALNSLDWLSHDEALIALRSRGVTDRPLVALSHDGKIFFKVVWLFALPCFILLLGLWRWWSLKHKQAAE